MRSLKGLVLAALVVCSVVALGASTAGATVVCLSNTTPCPSGSIVPSGTAVNGQLRTSTTAVLRTSGGAINPTITCTGSTVTVTSTSSGGAGLPVSGGAAIGGVGFTGCTSVNPAGCSATITSTTSAVGHIDWTTGLDGTLTLGPPSFPVTCPLTRTTNLNCTYGGSGSVTGATTHGTIGAAGTGTASIAFTSAAIPVQVGASCPTSASWTATYGVTRVGSATSGPVALDDH